MSAAPMSRRLADRLPSSPWLAPLNDRAAINDWLNAVNPGWSLDRIRARVLRCIDETPDTRSFVLQPNRLWPGFRAGQHVQIEVEIDGVRQLRFYSLSGAPQDRHPRITVRRQPGGRVSNWLHEHLREGDYLTLGEPGGDFVLPDPVPRRLLLIGAGSGVTPLRAILRDLHACDYDGQVVFLHLARDPDAAIFAGELRRMAAQWKPLRLVEHFSREHGRLDAAALLRLVPDFERYHGMLCGPPGLMAMAQALWQSRDAGQALQLERFTAPAPAHEGAAQVQVQCRRSGTEFAGGAGPLLVEAEAAGLSPRHGCRIGICRSCLCRKHSGTVENLLTGQRSSEPDELIQLCISAARSDLALDL